MYWTGETVRRPWKRGNSTSAALEQARETRRLDGDRYIVGGSLASEDRRATAGEASAQANLLRADLNYLLAKGELDVATGAVRTKLTRGR
jgi:hypothetical protein